MSFKNICWSKHCLWYHRRVALPDRLYHYQLGRPQHSWIEFAERMGNGRFNTEGALQRLQRATEGSSIEELQSAIRDAKALESAIAATERDRLQTAIAAAETRLQQLGAMLQQLEVRTNIVVHE